MTREEASNRLKQWIRNGCDGMTDERLGYIEGWFHKSDKEAFEQAIKALEQEPTDDYFRRMAEVVISQLRTDRDRLEDKLAKLEQEPSGDLISRQAVYEMLDSMLDDSSDNKRNQLVSLDSIADEIAELPSVNPQEPKTGHWIAEENEEMETIGYYCSECDLPMETEEKTSYCPNCGAKMESEDKG